MRVDLRLPTPLGNHLINLPPTTPLSALIPAEWSEVAYLRTRSSGALDLTSPLSTLAHASNADHPVSIDLVVRLRGGKGGFGANLRSAGGRMSANKSTNFSSCRDLNGRRLGSVKEAQKQAELLESLPDLKSKAAAEERSKVEAIERRLGVSSASADDEAGAASKRLADVDIEEIARKRHKFEDNKFLEESKEIKDNVRNAVSAALLKKKKKKAAEGVASAKPAKTAIGKSATAVKKAEKDTAKMPPPKVASATAA